MRRMYLCLAVVAGVAALVTAVVVTGKPEPDRRTVTLLFPKEDSTDNLLWPNNHAYVFSVNRAKPQNPALSAVIRSVHEDLKKATSPVVGDRMISKAQSDEEKVLAAEIDPPLHGAITVFVQLIDLSEVPPQAKPDNQKSRLRFGIRNRGFEVSLSREQTLIEGKYIGVNPRTNAEWKDGELHLMNLFMQAGQRLTIYDFVLIEPK